MIGGRALALPPTPTMLTNKKQIRALQAATESVINAAKGQATDPNAVTKLDQILTDIAVLKSMVEALAKAVSDQTEPKK